MFQYRAVAEGLLFYVGGRLWAARTSTAPVSGAGKTVLGQYPEYVNMAEQMGARRFQIPTQVWEKMTPAERWAANQKFLDRTILRDEEILMSTPLDKVIPGSSCQRELQYLMEKGFKVSPDGTRLLSPGSN